MKKQVVLMCTTCDAELLLMAGAASIDAIGKRIVEFSCPICSSHMVQYLGKPSNVPPNGRCLRCNSDNISDGRCGTCGFVGM